LDEQYPNDFHRDYLAIAYLQYPELEVAPSVEHFYQYLSRAHQGVMEDFLMAPQLIDLIDVKPLIKADVLVNSELHLAKENKAMSLVPIQLTKKVPDVILPARHTCDLPPLKSLNPRSRSEQPPGRNKRQPRSKASKQARSAGTAS
jgi:hypothetical protein